MVTVQSGFTPVCGCPRYNEAGLICRRSTATHPHHITPLTLSNRFHWPINPHALRSLIIGHMTIRLSIYGLLSAVNLNQPCILQCKRFWGHDPTIVLELYLQVPSTTCLAADTAPLLLCHHHQSL